MGRSHPGAGASGLKPLMAFFMTLAILSLCLFFGAGITNASRALAQTSDPAAQDTTGGGGSDPAPASASASAPASEPVDSGTVTDPAPASASASAPASEPVDSGTVTDPDPVYSEPDPASVPEPDPDPGYSDPGKMPTDPGPVGETPTAPGTPIDPGTTDPAPVGEP